MEARSRKNCQRNSVALVIIAGIVFATGALIYPLRVSGHLSDGFMFGSFSAFSHTLFFTVLWSFPFDSIRSSAKGALIIGGLAACFELTQLEHIREVFSNALPAFMQRYGDQGVFDVADLVAGFAGSVVAFGLIWRVLREGNKGIIHERPNL